MADPEQTPKAKPNIRNALQRFLIAMGTLAFVWLMFGQLVPRLLFNEGAVAPQPVAQEPAPPAPLAEATVVEEPAPPVETPVIETPVVETPPTPPLAIDIDRITELEAKLAQQELEMALLKQQFAAQLATVQDKNNSTLSTLVLFGQLKDAFTRGEPFAATLAQLNLLNETRPDVLEHLSALTPHAEKGITTPEKLNQQFSSLIPHALSAKEGNYGKTVRALVSIRKVGEAQGNDDEAILARAENALARGSLTDALSALEWASPPVKDALSGWVQNTNNYLAARQHLDALQLRLSQP